MRGPEMASALPSPDLTPDERALVLDTFCPMLGSA